jgi:hypothetical protein
MGETTPEVDIKPSLATSEQHRLGVIGAVAKRLIEEIHFRNILAVMVVSTLCSKEVQGYVVSSEFYMLAGLVLGMYFSKGDPKAE